LISLLICLEFFPSLKATIAFDFCNNESSFFLGEVSISIVISSVCNTAVTLLQ